MANTLWYPNFKGDPPAFFDRDPHEKTEDEEEQEELAFFAFLDARAVKVEVDEDEPAI